jgi:hypothetical protein
MERTIEQLDVVVKVLGLQLGPRCDERGSAN